MGIFDRLGSVINSHMNDFARETNSRFKKPLNYNRNDFSRSDPDLDAAYEELDDYLNRKETQYKKKEYSESSWNSDDFKKASAKSKDPPEELRPDFEYLGVHFGADTETCKAAYKKLLKIHHPDRHAGHAGNFKKATERSIKINASWERIEKWRNKN